VGLQFHEPPTLHPESHEILEEGMTIAIEPAIYIKGLGGIRTEENVVVTKDGYTLLSTYPRR
jgi:Xaa-Pro dipeptidase